jgi:hypothetical protein
MDELQFEWDEDKAAQNVAKHGVSFLTAAEIFANEIIEKIDDREELRRAAIHSPWPCRNGNLPGRLHMARREGHSDNHGAESEQI